MKRTRYPLALTILMLTLPLAALAGEGSWFDLENCDMCKQMTAEEGLMDHMEWENHLTADGYLSVTVVESGYEEKFDRAMANMEATGAKMAGGEMLHLCGFCQSFGGLYMAGATIENFETVGGHVSVVSSRDPAVIEQIHAHAKRTIDEYAKMAGDGHDHGDHGHSHH